MRQTGTGEDYPISYYLWCWNNPHPDRQIEYIEIVPKGHRFLVAGITLGLIEEHPFPRQGTREVELTLTAPETANEKFDIEVVVDRGEATLSSTFAQGFGRPVHERSPQRLGGET